MPISALDRCDRYLDQSANGRRGKEARIRRCDLRSHPICPSPRSIHRPEGPKASLLPSSFCFLPSNGGVAEWFKAAVLKTAVLARVPWVRITPPPNHTARSVARPPPILLHYTTQRSQPFEISKNAPQHLYSPPDATNLTLAHGRRRRPTQRRSGDRSESGSGARERPRFSCPETS